MLGDKMIMTVLPTTDLERSRKFYEDILGLKMESEMYGGMSFSAGEGTKLFVYFKEGGTKADHTVAGFKVDNLVEEMRELRDKGVVFEEYDIEEAGIVTEEGVAEIEGTKSAWFKDPDGNILNIVEMTL